MQLLCRKPCAASQSKASKTLSHLCHHSAGFLLQPNQIAKLVSPSSVCQQGWKVLSFSLKHVMPQFSLLSLFHKIRNPLIIHDTLLISECLSRHRYILPFGMGIKAWTPLMVISLRLALASQSSPSELPLTFSSTNSVVYVLLSSTKTSQSPEKLSDQTLRKQTPIMCSGERTFLMTEVRSYTTVAHVKNTCEGW